MDLVNRTLEHRTVASPFINRIHNLGLTVHVIGKYNHFIGSSVPKFLDMAGVRYARAVEGGPVSHEDVYIYWYNRINEPIRTGLLEYLQTNNKRVINFGRFTHDKRANDETFHKVFGYPLHIDPLTFRGEGVIKGNRDNGAKSARCITYPIDSISDDFVYQKLVKNQKTIDDIEYTYLYRIPVFDGKIPIMLGKHFTERNRFAWSAGGAEMVSPHMALSATEISLISKYCKEFEFDYGELDVLRDMEEDRIYIIDANATPYPHDEWVSSEEHAWHMILLTAALESWWPMLFKSSP